VETIPLQGAGKGLLDYPDKEPCHCTPKKPPWQDFKDSLIMINSIIWDVDGTLFDTYPAFTNAYCRTVRDLHAVVPVNHISRLARLSLSHCAEVLSQQYDLDETVVKDGFQALYAGIAPQNQPPFKGVEDVLDWVKSLGGVNLIATHRGRQSTERLLNAHGLSSYFAQVFSPQDGYPRKPDPAIFLEAMRVHELDPNSTLAVGDREIDIQAGKAAGLHTCLFDPSAESSSAQADISIRSYAELEAYLRGGEPLSRG
jgi:HAD superfamily hydrolase (TIGR01509 family)